VLECYRCRVVPPNLLAARQSFPGIVFLWKPSPSVQQKPRISRHCVISNAVILVAENSQNQVGLAHIIMRQDESSATTFSCKYSHLQSLFVLETNRRQGIGSQLLDSAEQWAREKGAAEIRLETWEFADSPLAFYEGLGYKTLRRTLFRALPA
jgi:GNAT superfamily N-acetyltransferase